jgi:hypothetical protein
MTFWQRTVEPSEVWRRSCDKKQGINLYDYGWFSNLPPFFWIWRTKPKFGKLLRCSLIDAVIARESPTKADIMSKWGSLFNIENDFTPKTEFEDNLANRALINVPRFVRKGKPPFYRKTHLLCLFLIFTLRFFRNVDTMDSRSVNWTAWNFELEHGRCCQLKHK